MFWKPYPYLTTDHTLLLYNTAFDVNLQRFVYSGVCTYINKINKYYNIHVLISTHVTGLDMLKAKGQYSRLESCDRLRSNSIQIVLVHVNLYIEQISATFIPVSLAIALQLLEWSLSLGAGHVRLCVGIVKRLRQLGTFWQSKRM